MDPKRYLKSNKYRSKKFSGLGFSDAEIRDQTVVWRQSLWVHRGLFAQRTAIFEYFNSVNIPGRGHSAQGSKSSVALGPNVAKTSARGGTKSGHARVASIGHIERSI